MEQSNPFVQLVSGVVWLLRNGDVYIQQSLAAECNETQETGTETQSRDRTADHLSHHSVLCPPKGLFQTFVDVVSARTAVGHDAEGRLILFHIDGQTRERG